MVKTSSDLKPAIYVGAAVSTLLLLLPYVNLIFLPSYLLGPLAAVGFELRHRERSLDFTQGARLGFCSAFYGSVAAIALNEITARVWHEQLWRFENLYRLPPLLAGKGLESDSPSGWYALMAQLVVTAIFAGAIGAPLGMLGVKIFQPSPRP
jgi:hypothetical protein